MALPNFVSYVPEGERFEMSMEEWNTQLRDMSDYPPILTKATRFARTDDSEEQRHRTKMIRCWRNTARMEIDLGWEPSPSVLTALETTPQSIERPAEASSGTQMPHKRTTKHRRPWWSADPKVEDPCDYQYKKYGII